MARIPLPAVLGFYDDGHDILTVATKAREEQGFKNIDAKPSWVGTVARAALISGWFLGFMLQSWTSAVDWPINIGGKPFVSWPAWIPVTFESGVLFAGFANLIAMFIACGLYPRPNTIVLSRRITNDRFVLVLPVTGPEEEAKAVAFLQQHKALKIKIVDGVDRETQQLVFRAAPLEVAV
jgi:hypothetical protein